MNAFFFTIIYVGVCAIYLLKMRFSPDKPNRIIFKCLPIGMLFGATMSYLKESRVLAIKSYDFLPRVYSLGGGLVFSAMSMIYSEFPSVSSYSLFSHAIALATYVYGFSSGLMLFADLDKTETAVGALALVLTFLILLYLVRNLRWIMTLLLALLSLLDAALVTTMSVLVMRAPLPPHFLGVIGVILIYASDVLQALSKWRQSIQNADLLIMTTYFTGQLFFTASILLVV